MKDIIPLSEIKLFSRRPDEVGYETLISTIERLLEMALSRVHEQEGGEDYRLNLLRIAMEVVKDMPTPIESPPIEPEVPRKPGRPKASDR